MLPDRVSNPGPQTYESGALLIALRGLAMIQKMGLHGVTCCMTNVSCHMLHDKCVMQRVTPREPTLRCYKGCGLAC